MRLRNCQCCMVVNAQVALEPDQGSLLGHQEFSAAYWRLWVARWRRKGAPRSTACLVWRPAMRLRHIRKDEGFMCRRIRAITADSFKPNWASIASKAVRSSQAISTTRERLASQSNLEDLTAVIVIKLDVLFVCG